MDAFILKDGPEIRTYSSPVYAKFLENSLMIYLNKHESKNLKSYQDKFNFRQIHLNEYTKDEKRPLFRLLEIAFSGVKKRYKTFIGERSYSHIAREQKKVSANKMIASLLYFPYFILAKLYNRFSIRKSLHLDELQHFKNINTLYVTAFNKHYINIICNLKEANPNLRIIMILHSEKDLLVDAYVPSICDELHLWKEENSDYIQKTYPFYEGEVKLMGVPRFQALNFFINQKTSIQDKRNFTLMYICAHPYIVNEEYALVKELIELSKHENISWIIRLNPMNDEVEKFEELQDENVKISYPNWEWSENKFFNMPSLISEESFFDDINEADLFLGGISTVALEACITEKKYLALCFDTQGHNEKLEILLHSGLYDKYIEAEQTVVCQRENDFISKLQNIMNSPIKEEDFKELKEELVVNV